MGKARTKSDDKRTPKHSRDAERPSKGGKGQRDAATVRVMSRRASGVPASPDTDTARGLWWAGAAPQDVQQDGDQRQEGQDPAPGNMEVSKCLPPGARLPCIIRQALSATRQVQEFQSKALPNTRIQPDRRWFGNTRVIGQKQLEQFRDEMSAKVGVSGFGGRKKAVCAPRMHALTPHARR